MNLPESHKLKKANKYDGIKSDFEKAELILFGAPFDGTSTHRSGAKYAPEGIRSETLPAQETFSPYFDLDLFDLPIHDIGDLDLEFSKADNVIEKIESLVSDIYTADKTPFMLGGEHLVTLGAIKAGIKFFSDLQVIHLDAHTDFIHELFGKKLSHGTVMRRVWDVLGDNRISAFGIRSGSREDFKEYEKHASLRKFDLEVEETFLKNMGNKPVYITIDLDVFDPSQIPGTGTPEAGGIWFNDFIDFLKNTVSKLNVVGMDLVELSPRLDTTGMSTIFAAKVSREMMCAFFKK